MEEQNEYGQTDLAWRDIVITVNFVNGMYTVKGLDSFYTSRKEAEDAYKRYYSAVMLRKATKPVRYMSKETPREREIKYKKRQKEINKWLEDN